MSVKGSIGAAHINSALMQISGDVSYIYSDIDKSYTEFHVNTFQGVGGSFGQFDIALSRYSSVDRRTEAFWESINKYDYIDRISVAYAFSDDLTLGITASKIGYMVTEIYLDYFDITADEIPKYFSYDAGMHKQFDLINVDRVKSNGSFALSIINIQNIQYGPIYSNYILPIILNVGISNRWQLISENYFYKNLSFNWGAGYQIYLNNMDYYHFGLGSEIGIMDYFSLGLGYYWANLYNYIIGEDEQMKGFTYGFGVNVDMEELFDGIPVTVQLKLVRIPQKPCRFIDSIDLISTGIQCEIGYDF